jgi:hypothetical protein
MTGRERLKHVHCHHGELLTWMASIRSVDVLRALAAESLRRGVSVLAVKGVVLARTLYDDPALRPMTDVDIRVPPNELRGVLDAAQSLGWKVQHFSRQWGAVTLQTGSVPVDVETTVGPPGITALSVATIRHRAVDLRNTFGFSCLAPDVHDHAVILCINLFKDKAFQAAPWVWNDLDRIVLAPGFDPLQFIARVCSARLQTVAYCVSDWMVDRSPQSPWAALRDALSHALPRPVYARWMCNRVRANTAGFPMRLMTRMASDGWTRQWLALAYGAMGTVKSITHGQRAGAVHP